MQRTRRNLLAGIGLVLLACGPRPLEVTPSSLVGRWETAEPRYAERWLEIRPDRLIWGIDRSRIYEYPIDRLEFEQQPDGLLLYRFEYTERTEGYEDALIVRLTPGLDPMIRLGTREEPWRRVR